MKNILLIADDLTGACDTGIKFQRSGWETTVLINGKSGIPQPEERPRAISVNTDTRSCSGQESFETVKDILRSIEDREAYYFYKKIDSVLRGNIIREIEAFFEVLGMKTALIVPGVPENGRFVKDGILYLGDPDSPDTTIDGMKLLEDSGHSCGSISLSVIRKGKEAVVKEVRERAGKGEELLLADSMELEDLRILSEALLELRDLCIPAGSAGLASELSEVLAAEYKVEKEPPRESSGDGALLIVVGSRHPVTVEQVRAMKDIPDMEKLLLEIEGLDETNVRSRAEKACEAVKESRTGKKRTILLTTDDIYNCVDQKEDLFSTNAFNPYIMKGLGLAASMIAEQIPVSSIIATGGDISAEVFRQLKLESIKLCDEPIPGIVTGMASGDGRCFRVATKSGGFGGRDAMAELCGFMQRAKLDKAS